MTDKETDMTVYNTICKERFSLLEDKLQSVDEKLDLLKITVAKVEDRIFNGISAKIDFLHKDLEDRRRAWRNAIIAIGSTAVLGAIGAATRWIFHLMGH